MQYAQTALVQIEASKVDEALRPERLLAALDEHRRYLKQQRGFVDMRVTRSVNPQGNVLLVVETRWASAQDLVDYETQEPNITGVISAHQDLIVPNTLQVLDMEAVRAGSGGPAEQAEQVTERLALPLLVPLGVLAFALLVIYGLSRVYLAVSNEVATGLAAGIAGGVLLIAILIATRPEIKGVHIAGIVTVAALVLFGGALYAVIDEDEGEAHAPGAEEPAANGEPDDDGAEPGPGGGAISMGDNFFEFEGEQEPAIPVAVGEEVTFELSNDGLAPHNMRVSGVDGQYDTDDDAVSDPEIFTAGDTGSITFQLDEAGEFPFRCDFHPIDMFGTIVAE
jgi:plastocyanin/heme-degrading monooxygenase HmoA